MVGGEEIVEEIADRNVVPPTNQEAKDAAKLSVNWPKVLYQLYLHMSALVGLWFLLLDAQWKTVFYFIGLVSVSTLGITAGAHRLWAHATYKATTSLRIFLMLAHTLACQGTIYDWVLDHRLHHKHWATNLDKYNYKKGFFYCHFSSHCVSEHSSRASMIKEIDMSDLEKDSVVMFQKKYYWILMPVLGLLLTVNAPIEYWDESIIVSITVIGFLRAAVLLHASWFIVSSLIVWGLDPNDKRSGDTMLIFFFDKSLWPQYHYVLPWDYRSGEYGTYDSGCTTAFIRIWAAVGLVSELSTITTEGVRKALATSIQTGTPPVECLNRAKTTASLEEALCSESEFY